MFVVKTASNLLKAYVQSLQYHTKLKMEDDYSKFRGQVYEAPDERVVDQMGIAAAPSVFTKGKTYLEAKGI